MTDIEILPPEGSENDEPRPRRIKFSSLKAGLMALLLAAVLVGFVIAAILLGSIFATIIVIVIALAIVVATIQYGFRRILGK